MFEIDATHAPQLESWVESAQESITDFPIQNLPFGVFSRSNQRPTIGVAIGKKILDLRACAESGLMDEKFVGAISAEVLNDVMALTAQSRRELRRSISGLLAKSTTLDRAVRNELLVDQAEVELLLPCRIGDYSDFYASIFHATNIGSMFRPDNPLLPNYKYIPIGYHGRASSIVVSGTSVRRPVGQLSPAEGSDSPTWEPCQMLDYELEIGCFVAGGNSLGNPIGLDSAEEKLFGLCLLNDWSARDIQKWEYQPLGPFLSKSFASTVSPWVVTMEALAPFRCAAFERGASDPQPLPYLSSHANLQSGGIDLRLEVHLQSARMRAEGIEPLQLSTGSSQNMYWTFAQMLTHHSSNGCNLRPGDLLGSGTVSGRERDSRGCLMELTWDGDLDHPVPGSQRSPLELPTGERRLFLADGDQVILSGYCQRDSYRRIGLGRCVGVVTQSVG